MKKFWICILLILLLAQPVQAIEFTAPTAPESAQELLPREATTFGADLWYVFKNAIAAMVPELREAGGICVGLMGALFLVSVLNCFSGISQKAVELVGTLSVGMLLVQPANAFIHLGVETVTSLSEYGKLLLPVMTGALAAEGGITGASTLYAGTVLFNTLLTAGISKLLVPMLYIYIAISIASSAIGEEVLKNIRDFVKWLMTWTLKITLYVFTGYMGITGVVSGTVDAASVKAAKLALSGFVPVVGSVISDASETILVSASVMKNTAGIYGILVMLALCIGPFIKIGVQYLILRLCGAVCGVFGNKASVKLIENFSSVMGFLLAMTGCMCLIHLVSTVCLMRGVSG